MVLAVDSLDSIGNRELQHGTCILSVFLGLMSGLQGLTLIWEDAATCHASNIHQYQETWETWQSAIYNNTWEHLQTLRIKGLQTSNMLLTNFLLRNTTSLRELSLIACVVGHTRRDEGLPGFSWDLQHGPDNCREMLEVLRDSFKLGRFQMFFNSEEVKENGPEWWSRGCGYQELANLNWEAELKRPPEDAALLASFVLGLCSWPMAQDNPGPPPFDDADAVWLDPSSRWTKLPQWTQT